MIALIDAALTVLGAVSALGAVNAGLVFAPVMLCVFSVLTFISMLIALVEA